MQAWTVEYDDCIITYSDTFNCAN